MQVAELKEPKARAAKAKRPHPTVFVDCADRMRQDVLAYWLADAGFRVRTGPLPLSPEPVAARTSVLLTDRFGPGLDGETTIFQLKQGRPGMRVVVVSRGDGVELAQLSLARAAGADATLALPLDRDRVLELVDRWS